MAVKLMLALDYASVLDVVELQALGRPTKGEAAGAGVLCVERDRALQQLVPLGDRHLSRTRFLAGAPLRRTGFRGLLLVGRVGPIAHEAKGYSRTGLARLLGVHVGATRDLPGTPGSSNLPVAPAASILSGRRELTVSAW